MMKSNAWVIVLATVLLWMVGASEAGAASGTWTLNGAGNWNLATTAPWSGGIVADGADSTASFVVNITANRIITLTEPRTIGHLLANDTTASHYFQISGTAANKLTLSVGSGSSTIDTVGTAGNRLYLVTPISGSGSIVKVGTGYLLLNPPAASDFGGAGLSFTLAEGRVTLYQPTALGNSATTFVIESGTSLDCGTANLVLSNYPQTWNGDFTFQGTQNLTMGTGTVTLGGNVTVAMTTAARVLSVGGITDGGSTFGLTKSGGAATTTLAVVGSSSYDGDTTISTGILRADEGVGLPSTSALVLDGGLLEGSGSFTRSLGSAAGNVRWTGSGGFSAFGGNLTVNIGGSGTPDTLTWDSTANFVTAGNSLLFGSTLSDVSTVIFQNPIDLNGAVRTINVDDKANNVEAEISGEISGAAGSGLSKTGNGEIKLSGVLSFVGSMTITGTGTVDLTGPNTFGGAGQTLTLQTTANVTLGLGHAQALGDPATTLEILISAKIDNTSGGALALVGDHPISLGNTLTFIGSNDLDMGAGPVDLGSATRTIAVTANTLTLGGVISGSGGALTKTGNGTLVLAGANTYDGITTLTSGTLRAIGDQSSSSEYSVTTGSTLDIGAAGIAGETLTVSKLTIASGTGSLLFEFDSTPQNDTISVAGTDGLSILGGKIYLYDEGTSTPWSTDGTYDLIQYSGTIGGLGFSALTIGNPAAGKAYYFTAAGGWIKVTIASAAGSLKTWDGGGADNNWSSELNWNDNLDLVGLESLTFAGATRLTPNNDLTVNTLFNGITFSGTAAFTLSGNAVNLVGNVQNSSTAAGGQTISMPLNLDGGSRQINTAAGGTVTISGDIGEANGSWGIVKAGSARTLVLSGANNTYTGPTTIYQGTLKLGAANVIPAVSDVDIATAGTLDLAGFSSTIDGLSGTGAARITTTVAATPVTLTIGSNNGGGTWGGLIHVGSSPITVEKVGTGTLVLGGANTYTGGLKIKRGTVVANVSNATTVSGAGGPSAYAITLGASDGGDASLLGNTFTVSNPIQLGANAVGILTLGNNGGTTTPIFSGGITGTGDLRLNNSGDSGIMTIGTGSVNITGKLTNVGTGSGTINITGVIGTNLTGVEQDSATSALFLSGANTYTSGLTIKRGVVIANISNVTTVSGAAGPSTVPITLGASDGGDASLLARSFTVSNPINLAAGAAGVLTIGNETTTYAPTFSGPIDLNGNDLTIARVGTTGGMTLSGGITGTGNVTIDNSGTTSTIWLNSNPVDITGSILVQGSSSGVVRFSGGIGANVTQLTLQSASIAAGSIDTSALTVNSGGTTLVNNNPSGTGLLKLTSGVGGTGNLILMNNSDIANGIQLLATGVVNPVGDIINSGAGTGNSLISAVIGASVETIDQNSATSGLTLSGANTFTGTVRIKQGTLTIGLIATLQSATVDMNAADSGDLAFTVTTATVGALIGSRGISLQTGTPAAVILTLNNNNIDTTYTGAFSGLGGITKPNNSSTLILGGDSSYDGATLLQGGTMRITHNNALGSTAGNTSLSAGAVLEITDGLTVPEPISLANTATLKLLAAATSTLDGLVTIASTPTIFADTGATLILGGTPNSISGVAASAVIFDGPGNITISNPTLTITTGAVTKNGTGTLTVNGAYGTTGIWTINEGMVKLGADNVLGSSNGNLLVGSVGSTATLDLAGYSEGVAILTLGHATGPQQGYIMDSVGGGTLTAATTAITLNAGEISAKLASTTTGIAMNKSNGGVAILSGDNIGYLGAITLTATTGGTLDIRHGNALGSLSTTTVNAGTVLQMSNNIDVPAENTFTLGGTLRNVSGNNTYRGTITLAANNLIESVAGMLTLDADSGNSITGAAIPLTFDGAGDITVVDTISGTTAAGTLTKNGSGVLRSDGDRTGAGPVAVNDGTLLVNGTWTTTGAVNVNGGATQGTLGGSGSIPTAVTIASGATLAPGDPLVAGGIGTLDINNQLTLADGAICDIEITDPANMDQVRGLTALNVSGAVTFHLYEPGTATAFFAPGEYDLMFYSGTAPSVVGLTVFGLTPDQYTFTAQSGVLRLTLSVQKTWNGSTDAAWTTGANWEGGTAPTGSDGETLVFGTDTAANRDTINDILSGTTFAGITFSGTAGAFNLGNGSSQTVTLQGSVVNDTANAQTLTLPLSLDGVITFDAAAGDLVLGSDVGPALATSGLLKTGAYTLSITGDHIYTGTLDIQAGTVDIGAGGGTGSVAGPIANAGTLLVNHTGAVTLSGAITGAGNLVKAGTGTLDLSSAGYTGSTTIGGGVLLHNGGVLGGAAISVADGAALITSSALSGKTFTIAGTGDSSGALQVTAGTTAGSVTLGGAALITTSGTGGFSSSSLTLGAYDLTLNIGGSANTVAFTSASGTGALILQGNADANTAAATSSSFAPGTLDIESGYLRTGTQFYYPSLSANSSWQKLGQDTDVIVGSGGTLDIRSGATGYTETIGSLRLDGGVAACTARTPATGNLNNDKQAPLNLSDGTDCILNSGTLKSLNITAGPANYRKQTAGTLWIQVGDNPNAYAPLTSTVFGGLMPPTFTIEAGSVILDEGATLQASGSSTLDVWANATLVGGGATASSSANAYSFGSYVIQAQGTLDIGVPASAAGQQLLLRAPTVGTGTLDLQSGSHLEFDFSADYQTRDTLILESAPVVPSAPGVVNVWIYPFDLSGVTLPTAKLPLIQYTGSSPVNTSAFQVANPVGGNYYLFSSELVSGSTYTISVQISSTPIPDIQLYNDGATLEIAQGNTPATADGTAFGMAGVTASSATVTKTFTIRNVDAATSDLVIDTVTDNSADFSVDTTGMTSTLAPGASTTFTVTFNPTSLGDKTAVISITSVAPGADPDENPYTFNVSGTGAVIYKVRQITTTPGRYLWDINDRGFVAGVDDSGYPAIFSAKGVQLATPNLTALGSGLAARGIDESCNVVVGGDGAFRYYRYWCDSVVLPVRTEAPVLANHGSSWGSTRALGGVGGGVLGGYQANNFSGCYVPLRWTVAGALEGTELPTWRYNTSAGREAYVFGVNRFGWMVGYNHTELYGNYNYILDSNRRNPAVWIPNGSLGTDLQDSYSGYTMRVMRREGFTAPKQPVALGIQDVAVNPVIVGAGADQGSNRGSALKWTTTDGLNWYYAFVGTQGAGRMVSQGKTWKAAAALDVNNSGVIIGLAQDYSQDGQFRFDVGDTEEHFVLLNPAVAINTSQDYPTSPATTAWVDHGSGGGMEDLNTRLESGSSSWRVLWAGRLNDDGVMVARAWNANRALSYGVVLYPEDFDIDSYASTPPSGPEVDVSDDAGVNTSTQTGEAVPADGDTTNPRHFGSTSAGSGTSIRTYRIYNLTASSTLSISGATATGDFAVTTQPAAAVVNDGTAPDEYTTITVTFAPTTEGPITGVISIFNTDCDEAVYVLNVKGIGTSVTPPETATVIRFR